MQPSNRFTYHYDVESFELFKMPMKLGIQIGTTKYPVIGVAYVRITVFDAECGNQPITIGSKTIGSGDFYRTFRYIYVNREYEPDIAYVENREYKGVVTV